MERKSKNSQDEEEHSAASRHDSRQEPDDDENSCDIERRKIFIGGLTRETSEQELEVRSDFSNFCQ